MIWEYPKNECGCHNRDVRCPNDNECVNLKCWKCGWESPRGKAVVLKVPS